MKGIIPLLILFVCLLSLDLYSVEQKNEGFSGYYIFDGKMYYYDQNAGTISPLSGDRAENKPVDDDLMQDIRKEEKNVPQDKQSKVASIAGNQDELTDEESDEESMDYGETEPVQRGPRMMNPVSDEKACNSWGSPLLGSKKYSGKDDCDNDLEDALDNLLLTMDKYVEKFDKEKTQMMIKSSLDEYNKLSDIKLDFGPSRKIITKTFEKGCVCLD